MRDPYFEGGKWWIDKDPEDKFFYSADVSDDLTVSGTTIASVEAIVSGVEKLAEPTFNGGKATCKLGGLAPAGDSFCTFRITCANTEQFDRTIWFKRIDN